MSLTAYPTLRLKLTMPQALKLQFLPAVPGFNASAAAAQIANKVNRPGDTMTGFLTLNADPTAPLHAATKQYVDTHGGGGGGDVIGSAGFYVFKDAINGLITKAIVGDDLPTAQNAALGAVKAKPAVTGQLLKALAEDGNFVQAAPTPADLAAWNVREKITAARSYFVRTDGNDSNNGRGNVGGVVAPPANGAFATIQKAIDTVCALDLSTFSATINVADGTYNVSSGTPAMTLKTYVGAGPISIVGNLAAPQNVIINTTNNDCILASSVMGQYNIAGFTLKCSTFGYNTMRANGGPTFIQLQNIRWDTALIHVASDFASQLFMIGTQEIIGDAFAHMGFTNKGIIKNNAKTITLTGTRTFSLAFAFGNQNGLLVADQLVFAGTATGKKFANDTLALIITNSGDVNYFPGTAAGTTWSGGYF